MSLMSGPLLIEPLAAPAAVGRRFSAERKVRLGDVGVDGRLRLDALARYIQDVSDDDTTQAGLPPSPSWVVRTNTIDELTPAILAETLHFDTFCSGVGPRWAERRLAITGSQGARYEVATVWVCVDLRGGRPHKLTDHFLDLYGEAAAGREASAKLVHPKPDPADEPILSDWHVRLSDLDAFKHVNNAAYWAVVEEWRPEGPFPCRHRIEYAAGVGQPGPIAVAMHDASVSESTELFQRTWWWLPNADEDGFGAPAASARSTRIPPDLYS